MPLTMRTIAARVWSPDGTVPLEGVFTARIAQGATTYLGQGVLDGTRQWRTTAGAANIQLPDSAQAGLDPDPYYLLTFRPYNKAIPPRTYGPFSLTGNTTLDALPTLILEVVPPGEGGGGGSSTTTFSNSDITTMVADAKARGNHTGFQLSSTVSDFLEAVQDAVAGMFGGSHTGISFSYNDTTGQLTATASGGGGTLDTEGVQDTVAAMFSGTHTNITFAYDDTLGRMTATASGGTGTVDPEVLQDAIGAMFTGGTHQGISFSYSDASGTLSAFVGATIQQVLGLQDALNSKADVSVLGAAPEEYGTFSGWIGAIQTQIENLSTGSGAAGAETLIYGTGGDGGGFSTSTVFGPYVTPVAVTLLDAVASLPSGNPSTADTVFDWEVSTTGNFAGPWSSVFGAFTERRPTVIPGDTSDISGAPSVTSAPAGSAFRVTVKAAQGAGGSGSYVAGAISGNGETTATANRTIPIPAGTLGGQRIDAVLFTPTTNTPTWPSGWTTTAVSFGEPAPNGPYYAHHAWKTASGTAGAATTESTTQQVTVPAISTILLSWATSGYSLKTLSSANFVSNTANGLTGVTPSGLSTTSADNLLVHLIMPRWTNPSTGGPAPSAITWTAATGLTSGANGTTNYSTIQNAGIALAREAKATAGSITARTGNWSTTARSLGMTFIYEAGGGPPDCQITTRHRPAA